MLKMTHGLASKQVGLVGATANMRIFISDGVEAGTLLVFELSLRRELVRCLSGFVFLVLSIPHGGREGAIDVLSVMIVVECVVAVSRAGDRASLAWRGSHAGPRRRCEWCRARCRAG